MKNKLINPFPPLSEVFFILVFLIGCFNFKQLLADGDTGYHVRAGEYILATHTVPHIDIFSFHKPVFGWFAHEWLSEVLMALIHRAAGLTGLVLIFALMLSAAYTVLFKYMKAEFNILIAAAMTVLVMRTSMLHWLVRPHVFSMFITIIWYILLNSYQYRNKKLLFFLPVITLVWVNLHGGYIIGLFLLGIFIAGNMGTWLLTGDPARKKDAFQKAKTFGLVLAACLAAALVNPRGYEILIFPFKFLSNKYLLDHNTELLSPNFHYLGPYAFYLYLVIAVLALGSPKLDFIETLIALFFTHLSLTSARHATLFSVMLAPIVARRLDYAWKNAPDKLKKGLNDLTDRILAMDKAAMPVVWSVAVFLGVTGFIYVNNVRFDFSPKTKPVQAVQFLMSEKIPGHMFCDDEFGDYILYKGWPEYRVFMDGRNDMYGARIMKQYNQIVTLRKPWKALLQKYAINWIIIPTGSALAVALDAESEWKLIYSDKVASIFMRNVPSNNPWINKYRSVQMASVLS